jgi:hypothetical protein
MQFPEYCFQATPARKRRKTTDRHPGNGGTISDPTADYLFVPTGEAGRSV